MQKLFRAGSLQEAYLVLHRLERAGIEAQVLNEHAQGGVGELPFTQTYPEVWLLEPEDAIRATAVLEEYERDRRSHAPDRVCRVCAELNPASFDLCWKCGTAFER